MSRGAVVLLSGGMDSATTLAVARAEGFRIHALTFSYGQRHAAEVERAREIARRLGAAEHRVVEIDRLFFEGSALTGEAPVPKGRDPQEIPSRGIPPTYVPARNTVFLAHALAWAEVIGARDIFIGVNAVDYSGYPDCRPQFIDAFQRLANLGTRAGVEGRRFAIHAPLIEKTKAEIIRLGTEMGVDFSRTHSCYDPGPQGDACGRCDSCLLRRKGFREAGIPDPTTYQEGLPPEGERDSLGSEGRE